jgi:hypothetical protein
MMLLQPERHRSWTSVVMWWGYHVPFALGRLPGEEYILLGEAYLRGYMDGEALAGSSFIQDSNIC